VLLRTTFNTFVPQPAAQTGLQRAAAAGIPAAALLSALPAFAEEEAAAAGEAAKAAEEGGFLNFGRIPLGGGFAINLDIPETGVINIVVLIGGLLYLLAPLLSESMATREKEIQTDIDDAIAKFNEATSRLAEAEKNKAQADQVIAEINASISKDQQEFEATIRRQTDATLAKQAESAEKTLRDLEANAGNSIDDYVTEKAVLLGIDDLRQLDDAKKSKFMDACIAAL